MTEHEFRIFYEGLRKIGRVSQVSGAIDCDDPEANAAGSYIRSHALLPQDYDRIPNDKIIGMGNLLFRPEASRESKESALIILAHQSSETALTILAKYNLRPDKGLEIFAEMALEECAMWNG